MAYTTIFEQTNMCNLKFALQELPRISFSKEKHSKTAESTSLSDISGRRKSKTTKGGAQQIISSGAQKNGNTVVQLVFYAMISSSASEIQMNETHEVKIHR